MPEAHRTLPLAEALPGMRLASALHDSRGAVLLPQGTRLTDSHIASLARRGVGSIQVVAETPPPSPAELEAQRAAARKRLQHLFRRAGTDPLGQELHQMLLEYRMEQLR